MEFNSIHPYPLKKKENNFFFSTENGIEYIVYFTNSIAESFKPQFPNLASEIFDFGFEPLNKLDKEIQLKSKHDPRIKDTIINVVATFFKENQKALIYTCSTLEGKQKARSRLFNRWFNDTEKYGILKFNSEIKAFDFSFYQSLLIQKDNPNFQDIKQAFFQISDEMNELK